MKCWKLARQVMAQREKEGVRGLDREWSRMRCHILTAKFVDDDVETIGKPAIREWLRDMAEKEAAGAGDDRKLSRQTISRCLSLLSAIFQEAVDRELRTDNPCHDVKPKKRVDERDTIAKWAFLTADEQLAIRDCEAIPRADRLAILFAANTGLRQAEQRHLRVDDVVVAGPDPCVHVIIAGRDREGRPLPPKSGKPRMVPLLPPALAVAMEWLELLPTYAPNNPHNLLFPLPGGGYRHQGKPLGKTNALKQHYQSAGIKLRPHLHWHALRHTFATNLLTGIYGRRWTLSEIQKLLGHSSVTITERYSHVGEDAIRIAVRETIEASAEAATPVAIVDVPAELVTTAREGLVGRFALRLSSFAEFVTTSIRRSKEQRA